MGRWGDIRLLFTENFAQRAGTHGAIRFSPMFTVFKPPVLKGKERRRRLKVTLLSALMSTESRFSEILPSRNTLIVLEPIDLSKFCKKYGFTHIHRNRKTY